MKVLGTLLVSFLLWSVTTKTYPISPLLHYVLTENVWFVLSSGVCVPEMVSPQESETIVTSSVSEVLPNNSFVYVTITHIRKSLHPT